MHDNADYDKAIAARECVACGRPCPPRLRWCSNACFYLEDGYPDDAVGDDAEEEETDAA